MCSGKASSLWAWDRNSNETITKFVKKNGVYCDFFFQFLFYFCCQPETNAISLRPLKPVPTAATDPCDSPASRERSLAQCEAALWTPPPYEICTKIHKVYFYFAEVPIEYSNYFWFQIYISLACVAFIFIFPNLSF